MKTWKTLSRKTVLDYGSRLQVESHEVELPDGTVISDWAWIICPDFVNVVVQTHNGKFLCFRQVKYGIEGESLAPVGGHVDKDEAPLAAAKRELLEETGYTSKSWAPLGSYPVMGNRGVATAHIFLAQDAAKVEEPNSDDLEEQELLYLTREELESAVMQGEFKFLTWTTSILLALRYLDSQAAA